MDLDARLKKCEEVLSAIADRNSRVEAEKAWETSLARKISIVILTYLLMCLVFYTLKVDAFALNAVVPTLGYFLSTLSLPVVKRIWLSKYRNR
jgi:hypothetical protein